MSVELYLNRVLPSKAVLLDITSIVRTNLAALKVCPPLIKGTGILATTAGLLDAKKMVSETNLKIIKAEEIDDIEGLKKAKLDEIQGIFSGFAGVGQLGSYLPRIPLGVFGLPSGVHLGFCFGSLAGASSLFLSLASAISVYYEWGRTSQFRGNLNQILQKNLLQKEKMVEALEFLRQQLVLTPEEEREILDQPHLAEEIKRTFLQKKVLRKTESLIREVGEEIAREVMLSVDLLLDSVQEGEPGALGSAQELILKVDRECFKQRIKQITTIAILVLSVAGTIVGFTLTGPLSPLLLFTITTLLPTTTSLISLSINSIWLREHIAHLLYRPKLLAN